MTKVKRVEFKKPVKPQRIPPVGWTILNAKTGSEGSLDVQPTNSTHLHNWLVGEDFIMTFQNFGVKIRMKLEEVSEIEV